MSVRKRVRKCGLNKKQIVYDAEVFIRGFRVEYKTFESRIEAELWHRDTKRRFLYGDNRPNPSEKMTFKDVVVSYREQHIARLKPVTQQSKEKPIEYLLSGVAPVKPDSLASGY